MKHLIFLLITSTAAFSQQFGDDNPSGDWLPIPDGFVWPAAPKGSPKFKPGIRKLADCSEEIQSAIRTNWPEDKVNEQIDIAALDLNADGKKELFVKIPIYGGSGGPYYEILSPGKNGYRSVGGIQGWGFQFVAVKNGWFQIEGMSRGGGGNYTRYLMSFGKEEFEITRNEGHDFNLGKVTIRKTPG